MMNQRELTTSLNIASLKYYKGESTDYTDTEFDLAFKKLQCMEKESGIVYPDSPTLRVGSDLQKEFGKIKHPIPMLTIENTYSNEELDEWASKMNIDEYDAEIKYDGVSCELHYIGGVFADASTRGDKNIGDDITLNVYGVHDIPFKIIGFSENENFRVRGEILMPKSVLKKINEERISAGEQPFANTRNACAGSIKQLDPKVTASRGLIFRAWDCYGDDMSFTTMTSKALILKNMGFKYEFMPIIVKRDNLSSRIEEIKQQVDSLNLDYDYDGIVIKVNSIDIQTEIGIKDTRAIEWGIARKWNEQYEAWTELIGVNWQVGRTGVVTPVGLLDPVECNGVVISNVTLHNADFIEKFDLHIGNDLKITRSGGVIPYVLECKHDLLMEMNNAYPKVKVPDVCPVCGEPLVREGGILKCVNKKCPAIVKGKLIQYCSKDGMDIQTIGEKVIDDIVAKFGFWKVSQLYFLLDNKPNVLSQVMGEGYGVKKCQNIMKSLIASLDKPFDVLLASLSIPNVGKSTARLLASHFKSYEALKSATISNLTSIDGIGEVMAKDIVEWFKNPENEAMVYEIGNRGMKLEMEDTTTSENNGKLLGLSIVFSGKSSRFSGDEVEAFLEKNGAKCGHSISKKTDYLIIGEKAGPSKIQKATELGVKIIEEQEFFKEYGI